MKWLNVLLGLWVVVSPFLITGGGLKWSNVIVGIVIAVLAYMATSAKTEREALRSPAVEARRGGTMRCPLGTSWGSHARRYFTTTAVTIPCIPRLDSAWERMWQCRAHTPG